MSSVQIVFIREVRMAHISGASVRSIRWLRVMTHGLLASLTASKKEPQNAGIENFAKRLALIFFQICPVCGQYEFMRRSAELHDCCFLPCKVCGWVDDSLLEVEPDFDGGELGISLNQARAAWKAKQKQKR